MQSIYQFGMIGFGQSENWSAGFEYSNRSPFGRFIMAEVFMSPTFAFFRRIGRGIRRIAKKAAPILRRVARVISPIASRISFPQRQK